jgi:hypothetical protein
MRFNIWAMWPSGHPFLLISIQQQYSFILWDESLHLARTH